MDSSVPVYVCVRPRVGRPASLSHHTTRSLLDAKQRHTDADVKMWRVSVLFQSSACFSLWGQWMGVGVCQRRTLWSSPLRCYVEWDHVYCVSSVCFCISCICSFFDGGFLWSHHGKSKYFIKECNSKKTENIIYYPILKPFLLSLIIHLQVACDGFICW